MEGNIISFKVLMDSTGKLVTESSILELPKMKDKLTTETYNTLKTIIRVVDTECKKLHNKIENELDSRSYKN